LGIEELTQAECRAVLAGVRVGHLACAREGQPYIIPTHLDFDGDCLYGFATLGQKIEWMRINPLVCFEAADVVAQTQWSSVVVFGHYEELPDSPEFQEARQLAQRLFQRRPMWWEPAMIPLELHGARTPILFRIRIDQMTGRRSLEGKA
jgi:nitroimidazol reductase NimA-like FMN-containing flavoprotein (pyridoxamine 5'-phosphate oxidase superfamily)